MQDEPFVLKVVPLASTKPMRATEPWCCSPTVLGTNQWTSMRSTTTTRRSSMSWESRTFLWLAPSCNRLRGEGEGLELPPLSRCDWGHTPWRWLGWCESSLDQGDDHSFAREEWTEWYWRTERFYGNVCVCEKRRNTTCTETTTIHRGTKKTTQPTTSMGKQNKHRNHQKLILRKNIVRTLIEWANMYVYMLTMLMWESWMSSW